MTATATLTVSEEQLPTFLPAGRAAGVVGGVLASVGYASGSGLSPGATGADNVVFAYTLPANTLNYVSNACAAGGPSLRIRVRGHTAANGNNKTVKVIFNPATATVGSTVGSGGTTLASTGVVTINAKGFVIDAWVKKVGLPNANTQVGGADAIMTDATAIAVGVPGYPAAVENADILIAVTANCATAVTDVVVDSVEIIGFA
jgi:hypothetical protein